MTRLVSKSSERLRSGMTGEFVLVGLDGNPVQRLLEQIDAGRRVEREHLLAHRRGQLRVHLVEGEDDVDRSWRRGAARPRRGRSGRSRGSAGEMRNSRAGSRTRGTIDCRSGSGPRLRSKPICRIMSGAPGDDDRIAEQRRARENRRRGNARRAARRARPHRFPGRADGSAAPSPGMTKIAAPACLRLLVGGLVLAASGRPHGELQSKARGAVRRGRSGSEPGRRAALVRYSALTISNGHSVIGSASVNRQATLRCASR